MARPDLGKLAFLLAMQALLMGPRPAFSHSLITCVDYRPEGSLHASPADANCHARPRGLKRTMLDANTPSVVCLYYRPGNGGHAADEKPAYGNACETYSSFGKGGFACDPDVQRRTVPFDAGYSSAAPYALYKRGRDVCLEWPTMSHCYGAKSRKFPSGAPYSPGIWYIHAVPAKLDKDASQADFLAGKSWELPFDDCSPDDNAEKGWEAHAYYKDMEGGCFKVGSDMSPGLWTFQAIYEQNENEWYSTCWDAVVSDTGDAYTAPPPGLKSPVGRTIPSAGLDSTKGWQAAPLQQVSSNPPACPAGTSGQLCTAAGSAGTAAGPSPAATSPAPSSSFPLARSGLGLTNITDGGAPDVPGYEKLPGQELKGKFYYPCKNTVPPEYDHSSSECAHDGLPPDLAQLCTADSQCQALVWYPNGTAGEGRNTPTAWFKGGPSKVDVHATNANPAAVTYIKM